MDGVAAPDSSDEDEEYDRLPAGNEKEWQKQCYFCGVMGSKRKNIKRGKKGAQFVRRLRTQRENPDECAHRPSTGMPSKKYFPPDTAILRYCGEAQESAATRGAGEAGVSGR